MGPASIERALPQLRSVLHRSGDAAVIRELITALGILGPAAKRSIPKLEKLSEHEDRQIAERAKAALRQVRGR